MFFEPIRDSDKYDWSNFEYDLFNLRNYFIPDNL